MQTNPLTRRNMLRRGGLLLGSVSLLVGLKSVSRAAAAVAITEDKTPPLSKEAMAALDTALGKKGTYVENEGVYTTPLPRNDQAIGLNTWATFAGEPDAAHVAGDVAMLESEVNKVIRALREHDLEVVAVHQHMLEEQPRIIFLHYYGRGRALTLAEGFRAALEHLGGEGKPVGS